MDLNTLNTAALDERGALFTPRHPATLEPLDMAIRLRSKNCESVRAKARAFIKRIQTSADFRKTGIVDADLAEAQAIDRTHRIGQTKNVVACRLILKDSIEEKIRTLQRQKAAIVDDLLGDDRFAESLSLDDLKFLFEDPA